jgi:two-component system invasion response regulator UvrY
MIMSNKSTIKIALVDDHVVLRNALAVLIDNFENCKVIYQANDGKELTELIRKDALPDILILDMSMPNMDGYDTARWIQKNCPTVKILMLTMYDSEMLLIRLLKAGVNGFLKKDIHPTELKQALHTVMQVGHYYASHTAGKVFTLLREGADEELPIHKNLLGDQEINFLKLACSDLTYKEIAIAMRLNPRAVDSLRDHLFEKLDVKSRVGLAIFALRKGMVAL